MISLDSLFTIPPNVRTRWASPENPLGAPGQASQSNAGRKGRPCIEPFAAGQTVVLAEHSGGPGIVRRIWITISERSPLALRGVRIDAWWDGQTAPAVSAPLGDFFGIGLGRCAPFQSALFSNAEGRSFNCVVPMPFRSGMKIALTNETGGDIRMLFYDVDYTLGDELPADALYLHAHWRRENPTAMQRDYEILPLVAGRGRYLGANFGVIADARQYFHSWWGEGEVKIYLDGDREYPTLCGTGTEDYIGTAWGQDYFVHLYQGCPVADRKHMQYCFYRYHIPDPIYFHRDIRATIQQIGCWSPDTKPLFQHAETPLYLAGPGQHLVDVSKSGGSKPYGLFERTDDWSSCAYFYLDQPANRLPPLPAADLRTGGLDPAA